MHVHACFNVKINIKLNFIFTLTARKELFTSVLAINAEITTVLPTFFSISLVWETATETLNLKL